MQIRVLYSFIYIHIFGISCLSLRILACLSFYTVGLEIYLAWRKIWFAWWFKTGGSSTYTHIFPGLALRNWQHEGRLLIKCVNKIKVNLWNGQVGQFPSNYTYSRMRHEDLILTLSGKSRQFCWKRKTIKCERLTCFQ